MAIKESSDELNPLIIAAVAIATSPRPARSVKDYVALAVATCGVGYIPWAPGTCGSLVGIGVYALLRALFLKLLFVIGAQKQWNLLQVAYALVTLELLTICCVALAGVWAASRTEKLSGKKDPAKVVVDEVAGQMIALLPVSLTLDFAWWTAILAFLLFRLFDIIKPYPCRQLERLPSGLGIMADDIVAGVYAGLAVALIVVTRWLI
ncbi:MAG: phosphatidylglycerophosphatase A [Acidobacteriota bacterium]|nr:phosphatidylglycerophosphatase A [Acidobacteriota bacterium]